MGSKTSAPAPVTTYQRRDSGSRWTPPPPIPGETALFTGIAYHTSPTKWRPAYRYTSIPIPDTGSTEDPCDIPPKVIIGSRYCVDPEIVKRISADGFDFLGLDPGGVATFETRLSSGVRNMGDCEKSSPFGTMYGRLCALLGPRMRCGAESETRTIVELDTTPMRFIRVGMVD